MVTHKQRLVPHVPPPRHPGRASDRRASPGVADPRRSSAPARDPLGDRLGRLGNAGAHDGDLAFDAAQVLSELCSTSQALADARGLQLEMNGPQSLPVVGDEVKLRRIVQNLLLNSLKYTEQGGVVVAWGPAEVARWSLSITDTGPGFDPGLAPFVDKLQDGNGPPPVSPQPAKQGNVQRAESQGIPKASAQGEGVGLTIVKRLCELLDAALELETKPGVGTTFRVIFPMRYD